MSPKVSQHSRNMGGPRLGGSCPHYVTLSFAERKSGMSNPKIETFETATKSDSKIVSRETSNPSANRATRDAIKEFLEQNSSGQAKPRYCSACGETMEYLDAYFWLDGTDVASLIPLPFCPVCQPDLLASLRREPGLKRIPS